MWVSLRSTHTTGLWALRAVAGVALNNEGETKLLKTVFLIVSIGLG